MPIDVRMLEEMQRRVRGIPDGARCRKCGYEITGLKPSQRCPECGSALSFDDRLANAAPGYVKQLHIGSILVEISLVLTVLLVISAIGGGIAQSLALLTALELSGLLVAIMAFVGWWLLSSPDPGLGKHDEGQRSRIALRVLLAVQIVGDLLSLLPIAMAQSSAPVYLLIQSAGLITWMVGLAAFVVSMLYVRVLAGRIPDHALIEKATNVLRLGVAGVIGFAVLIVLGIAAAAAGAGLGLMIAGCGFLVFGIGALVWFVMYLVLIDAIRTALAAVLRTMPG